MSKMTKIDQKTAELFKDVPSLESDEAVGEEMEPVNGAVVKNIEDYPSAIVRAQMNGEDFIEVSPEVFAHPRIGGHTKKNSFTTGKPAVRVWKQGCREQDERMEKMKAEEYHDLLVKQARGV